MIYEHPFQRHVMHGKGKVRDGKLAHDLVYGQGWLYNPGYNCRMPVEVWLDPTGC